MFKVFSENIFFLCLKRVTIPTKTYRKRGVLHGSYQLRKDANRHIGHKNGTKEHES